MTDERQKEVFSKNLLYYMELYEKNQREVANAIGVSPQTFNTWIQKKALPRMGKVQLLAEYFHINKSDLIEERNTDTEYYLNPETREIAQEIYENKDLSLLFDAARDAAPEDLKTVHTMLMALKAKEEHRD